MKRIVLFVVFTLVFIMKPSSGSHMQGISHKMAFSAEISTVLETLTYYNPAVSQCDNTPLITASNARIDTVKLRKQQLRWMALSRDLLKRWEGKFNYGDTVNLYAGDQQIDGLWIIQDNMNKRYKNRGDLLLDGKIRTVGKWKNVRISKLQSSAQPA